MRGSRGKGGGNDGARSGVGVQEEGYIVAAEDLELALRVVREVFGEADAYYAGEAARASGFGVALLVDGRLAGGGVGYLARGPIPIGVVYYIALLPEWRGRGLGRVLLASVEELLDWLGSRVYLATASSWNDASLALFGSMGYTVLTIEEAAREIGWQAVDALLHAACSYEDDVLMVKPWEPAALRRLTPRDYMEAWWETCYEPWLRRWRGR